MSISSMHSVPPLYMGHAHLMMGMPCCCQSGCCIINREGKKGDCEKSQHGVGEQQASRPLELFPSQLDPSLQSEITDAVAIPTPCHMLVPTLSQEIRSHLCCRDVIKTLLCHRGYVARRGDILSSKINRHPPHGSDFVLASWASCWIPKSQPQTCACSRCWLRHPS